MAPKFFLPHRIICHCLRPQCTPNFSCNFVFIHQIFLFIKLILVMLWHSFIACGILTLQIPKMPHFWATFFFSTCYFPFAFGFDPLWIWSGLPCWTGSRKECTNVRCNASGVNFWEAESCLSGQSRPLFIVVKGVH